MWKEEAAWIGEQIKTLNFHGDKVDCLNIGSSTKEYRELIKPYIHELVIEPIEKLGKITNIDAKEASGVDICGDLCDPNFRLKLSAKKYNLILCNNVLTHVQNPDVIYDTIIDCLADRGFAIITAPTLYPYCADPYDSKYRPAKTDIENKLSLLKVLITRSFQSSETQLSRLAGNRRLLLAFLLNIFFPRRGLQIWRNTVSDLVILNKRFESIGVVLQNITSREIQSEPK